MHRNTYRKRENLILNLNQRTPSTIGYQTGRGTYMMWKNPVPEDHEKTTSCQRKLDRKIITFSHQTLLIKIVVRKCKKSYKQHFATQVTSLIYPCYYQQIVSKISPLLCPFSLPRQGCNLRDQENIHTNLLKSWNYMTTMK